MNKLWQEFQVNLSESAILRWSLLLIVLILLLEIYFQIHDARQETFEEMGQNQSLYLENSEVGNLASWQQYVAEMKTLNNRLNKQLWVAKTEGEGRALVQKRLDSMMSDLKSRNLRLRVGSAVKVSDNPVIWEVQFQVNARAELESSLQLVQRISRQQPTMVLKELRIDSTRNNILSLTGSAFFLSDWS